MSRAEFIYLIMNEVYGADEVQNYDTSKTTLKDCNNAGNLSEELKIADSDRCNGYTLKYSLENIDKGVTEELYKSIAMAADKDIITTETRWNEGITKSEAIEIVVNAFMQYYDEQGYLVNSAEKGSTQALEAAAEALWNKQDQNDMNCTKEEFTADYIKLISDGMSPEEFEKQIQGKYSIKFAEEQAAKEKQAYIDQIWDENKDKLTCDKETFTSEYESYAKEKADKYVEGEFIAYITDKYAKPKENKDNGSSKSNNNNSSSSNSNGGSSSNGGGSSNSNGGSSSSSNNTNNNGGGSSDWRDETGGNGDDLSGGPDFDPDFGPGSDNWIHGGM